MKVMRKLVSALLAVMLMVSLAMTAMADDAVPGAELRAAADALDLGGNASACMGEFSDLHKQGVHLFDTAGLMSSEERDKLEQILAGVSQQSGMDVNVVTSKGLSNCKDAEDFTDLLYYEGKLGSGSNRDGSLLMISVNGDDRDVTIYGVGMAERYLTERGKNYIFDELRGGMYTALVNGQYAQAAGIYAEGVLTLYNEGVQQDQVNQNTETGETDPYYPEEKKGFSPVKTAIAAVISAISGFVPVSGVKRKYAMAAEKNLARGFNQAYKASAVYNVMANPGKDAVLIDRITRTIPIPRPQNTNGRGGGTGGHGGGVTHVSSGRGGGTHTASSRKF